MSNRPTLEDQVRQVLHPEAAHKPLPKGCDQQGRYPQAAEPCVDLDEIDELGLKVPPPEPWWQNLLLAIVALLVLLLILAPLGK